MCLSVHDEVMPHRIAQRTSVSSFGPAPAPRAIPCPTNTHSPATHRDRAPDIIPSRHYGNRRRSVLLTNASRRLSGDQDGTLIVPCPPYTYATTRALPPPPRVDITRR